MFYYKKSGIKTFKMNQKLLFTENEGNAFFHRNKKYRNKIDMSIDPIVLELDYLFKINAINFKNKKLKILEVGCGDGLRGSHIKKSIDCDYYGIDPSSDAVNFCNNNGLIASVSTADKLLFKDNFFDIVIFGFCLYLCDREDLNEISNEASRVLNNKSWVIIMDFFSKHKSHNAYHHLEGVKSYKTDYRDIFDKTLYTCYSHKILDHKNYNFTETEDEWISISSLRKDDKLSLK